MKDNLRHLDDYRRPDQDDPSRVPCARCGSLIRMRATTCPVCGVHFQGLAMQFNHPSNAPQAVPDRKPANRLLVLIVAVGVLLGLLALVSSGSR